MRPHVSCALKTCLIQREHVEVADVVLLGVFDPGATLLLVDHLAHVLAHKRTLKGAANGLVRFANASTNFPFRVAVPTVIKSMSLLSTPVLSSVYSSIVCTHSVLAHRGWSFFLSRYQPHHVFSLSCSLFPGFDPAYVFLFVSQIIQLYILFAISFLTPALMILRLPFIKHTKRLCTCILASTEKKCRHYQ